MIWSWWFWWLMIACALLDELKELLVCYNCLSLYGSIFKHVMYWRICSFLRGDFVEIFARTKWVISSSNYFWWSCFDCIYLSFFYDEVRDKYDMFLDKIILVKILNWLYIQGEHTIWFWIICILNFFCCPK